MTMKKCRLTISVLCVMGFMLFLWISAATAQQKPTKLTYSHFWPVGHPVTALLADWAKEVEKRTDGRVAVIMFPAGTLTPADKIYDGVVKGISNLGSSALSYTRGRFPHMEVIDLPLGYKNATIATNLTNALYKKFQPKELDDTKVMYFQGHGPGIFHTKKPVRSLEELKGMKIRTTGLGTKIVTALGATPVAMTMGETYDALAKGVVDGSIAPISSLVGFRWGEVVRYTTENFGSAYTAAFFVVMNKDTWNGLPPEVQKIIEGVNEEWIKKTGLVWDEYDNKGRDFALKLGNQTIRLSKEEDELWVKKVSVTFDDYLKDMEKKGLPGTEALDFCRDFLKKN